MNTLQSLLVALLTVTAALSAACSPERKDGTLESSENTPTDGTFVIISPTDLASLIEGASETQRSALQDGRLTSVEYEAAFLGVQRCITEAGLIFAMPLERTGLGNYYYELVYPPGQIEYGKQAHAKCQVEHIDRINQAWSRRDNPAAEDVNRRARESLRDCLRAGGMEAPDQPVEGDFRDLLRNPNETFLNCLKSVQEAHNLPGWGG